MKRSADRSTTVRPMNSGARVLLVGCCLVCSPAFASLSQVLTPGGLGSNDFTNWAQLGGDETGLAGPFSATSAQSIGVTGNFSATDNTGLVAVVCPATPTCTWGPTTTGMVGGDTDIWAFDNGSGLGTGPITLSLGTSILGAGLYIQGDTTSAYTAAIQAFSGSTSLGAFSVTSDSDGDPVFLGLKDTSAVISQIQFSLTSCAGCSNLGDFAVDTLLMTDVTSTTPEPSSVLLFGGGMAGLAWTLRRRSSKHGRRL
jgi:hypothetical protein